MSRIIPYSRQWIGRDDIKAVEKVLLSDHLTQGPAVEAFEKAVARFCRAKYAVAVNSGTSALHIACIAAGLKKGDEAIVPAITFVASSNAVLYCGASPVFADIDHETVCIDPEDIRRKITPKTKVIIPVDFAGHPADLKEIKALADKHNLIIIEDAAHAFGSVYRSNKIGNCRYADMAILSFHPLKHITTAEGGMVLTNSRHLYRKLLKLRSHGITKDANDFFNRPCGGWYHEMQELGYNYRLTDLQCALGLSQLKKIRMFIKRRKEIVRLYNNAFKNNSLFDLPKIRDYVKPSWHLYVIRLKGRLANKREEIFLRLRKEGLWVQVHYIPVYWQPYYRRLGFKKGICPKAEKYYKETISLPIYPKMTDKDARRVIAIVKKVVKQ